MTDFNNETSSNPTDQQGTPQREPQTALTNSPFYEEDFNPQTLSYENRIEDPEIAHELAITEDNLRSREKSLQYIRETCTEEEINNELITQGLLEKYPQAFKEYVLKDGSHVAMLKRNVLSFLTGSLEEEEFPEIRDFLNMDNTRFVLSELVGRCIIFSKDGISFIGKKSYYDNRSRLTDNVDQDEI